MFLICLSSQKFVRSPLAIISANKDETVEEIISGLSITALSYASPTSSSEHTQCYAFGAVD